MNLTQDQVNGYIRTLCTILGTLATAGAPLTAQQIGTIGAGLQGIVGLVFLGISIWQSTKAHSVNGIASAAQGLPDENKIQIASTLPAQQKAIVAASNPGTVVVAPPDIAASTPQPNIVSNAENAIVKVTP